MQELCIDESGKEVMIFPQRINQTATSNPVFSLCTLTQIFEYMHLDFSIRFCMISYLCGSRIKRLGKRFFFGFEVKWRMYFVFVS